MKIWVVTMYEPLPFRGPGTRPQRCGMLADALLSRGHEVELWTSSFEHIQHRHLCASSLFSRQEERFGVQFIHGCGYSHDRSPRRWFHNRQMAREFTRLAAARAEPPDLIFAPVPSLELAQAAVEFGRSRNVPVVVDIRDPWPDVYLFLFPELARPFFRPLFRREYRRLRGILNQATAVTAVSETFLDWGLRHAGRERGGLDRVFYLGFPSQSAVSADDLRSRQDDLAGRLGIQEGQFVAVFVGSFSRFYDVRAILKAARLLSNDRRVHFIIAGSGDEAESFQAEARLLPNVSMPGWLDLTSVLAVLGLADLGLIAYSDKATMSLPNKPFEYMAAGLPLLSSLKGELEAIIEKNSIGRSYRGGDAHDLAGQVQLFLENIQETKKMGKRSLVLFRDVFRSEKIYTGMAEHLENITANKRSNEYP